MKKMTLISSSLSLGLLLALSGCNSTQADAQTVTVSGKAIDPYLKDATVYMDTNANGKYDQGEPNATTNAQGDYDLNVSQEYANKDYTVYATGGTDMGTGKDFNGTLTAVQDKNVTNITPLTTLVQARYNADKNATLAEIQAETAKYLALNVLDLDADIVKLADEKNETKPLKVALALEKLAEAHAAADVNQSENFYKNRAKYIDKNTTLLDDENLTGQEVQAVTDILSLDDQNSTVLAKAAGEAAANAGIAAGDAAAHAGAQAGHDAANAGVQAGSDAANTGIAAGRDAANTGVQAGETAANAGAQAGSDAANAGVAAGSDAANAGVTAGQNAAHQGAQAGNDAGNAGAQAGSDAANAGAQTGNDAANQGATAGNNAAHQGAQAGSDAANTGVETGNNSAKEGATLGAQTTGL